MDDRAPSRDRERRAAVLRAVLATTRHAGSGFYLGRAAEGADWQFAPPEHALLVLGPPRSGKTTSLVVPNVISAPGAVVTTSTKPDVLRATLDARRRAGRCLVFDPGGRVLPSLEAGPGAVVPLRWSPVSRCRSWTEALLAADRLVRSSARSTGEAVDHWHERAGLLVATMLHAAARGGGAMADVLAWVDTRSLDPARAVLEATSDRDGALAAHALAGLARTDERELSGIWSTAAGTLSGYRSAPALSTTEAVNFDPDRFVRSGDTLYICAPADLQHLLAPLTVALLSDIRRSAYAAAAGAGAGTPPERTRFVLDEVANIAPLPDLPSLVSEGGGQGVITMACFQDLSQARTRWGGAADGFLSLFGTSVVLPGIGDVATLDALSTLSGTQERIVASVDLHRRPTGVRLLDAIGGGTPAAGRSWTHREEARLAPHALSAGRPGHALVFDAANRPAWVALTPAHAAEPWSTLSRAQRERPGPSRSRA